MPDNKYETPLERQQRLIQEADKALELFEGYALVFIPAFIIFGLLFLAIIAYATY